jgi:CRP/FNR family transcriptional regulator, cyclic AMP receptor protein
MPTPRPERRRTAARPSIVDVLRSASLFGELSDDVIASLAEGCVSRTYRRGQYLWYQGDEGSLMVVVASGLVKVVLSSEQGDEVVLVTLGPGKTLGELALLDGSPRSASVVAVEPTTVVMMSRATLLDLLGRHPPVLDALLRSLGGIVRRQTEQTGDLVFLDLGGRIAKLLLRLAEPQLSSTGPVVLDLGFSQSDLASMVGATRPAVNRVLQAMASRGLIAVHGQVIELRDLPRLRRRAEV